jgi:hypothetical protein
MTPRYLNARSAVGDAELRSLCETEAGCETETGTGVALKSRLTSRATARRGAGNLFITPHRVHGHVGDHR